MRVNDDICKGCDHYRRLSTDDKRKVCHYLLDTGTPRGCPISECDKKEVGVTDLAAIRKKWAFTEV